MANARAIQAESTSLRAIATVNGRARCGVFVYATDADQTLLTTGDANLADPRQREQIAERVDVALRDEVADLLMRLAADVAKEQTQPKGDATAEDPFPRVEPWGSPVPGAAILDELCALLARYMVLPPHATEALALWIAHTYVTDVTDYTPYVLITSPVRECGKSTLLDVLEHVAYRAQKTGGITAAALYRRIDRLAPTMLLDELDTRLRGDSGEVLRGVLNNGFQRGGKVTICVGDDHEDRDFSVYCAKVLAGIGRVWDTVTSRSIPIRLARASREQLARLAKVRGDRIGAECEPYRRRLVRWAADVTDSLRVTDPVTPCELGARQCDVWRPLLAIADVAGGRWPAAARNAALALHGVAEEEGDYGLLMLADVRELLEASGEDAIFSATIAERLAMREDRPWPEYRNDRPISKRQVASLLGRFDVKPRTVRVGIETAKGYHVSDLAPVFRRYLPTPVQSVTSVTSALVTLVTDKKGEAWEP